MRVYFNTSALNRPLDDLSSERVRLEAEAVVGLLAAVGCDRHRADLLDDDARGADDSAGWSTGHRAPARAGGGPQPERGVSVPAGG